ncbi:glycine cleavage system aminomethyltransferase GcvT [Marinactinospora thermotolerans]|uniref:Aminomethyltransferase n=1 Tax=Marinactinospora thermotolerans DSM 45154 TaxID=1122192 RepID=A0A1T4RVI5_9ACTN|nr:glycine cleavage system aminomethyltransferase GcvT [Marinactinospora thermotolerans]SKA20000.1 aminomethyltransferase [Marinactinospora thermotolerans DSM 45154]
MTEPTTRTTPLHEVHERLGATMVDFAGWAMPLRYGSETAEHKAVREAAGLFDLSHMGEIHVAGPQAAEALDYALVGHLSAVTVGRARYTMITDADGGVLDDLIVYRLAGEEFLVVANAANTAVVAAALRERAAGLDAEISDESADYALIAIQGPRAAEILAPLTDADLDTIKYYAGYRHTVAGQPVLLARTGYTGEDGFEIFLRPGDQAPAVWEALVAAGRPHGLLPAGLSARDTLRLEAGMPLYGNELSTDVTPYEAGLGRVVKLDKPGDFVGRAALAARAESGPVRKLVGLVGRGRRVPRQGYAVMRDDQQVGTVTSGAPSPTLGKPVAVAYVDADVDTASGTFAVDVRGRAEVVDLVELPFYRRER